MEFLSLSHSQANGIMVLLPLLAAIILSGPAWHFYISRQPEDTTEDEALLDSLVALWVVDSANHRGQVFEKDNGKSKQLFKFDPNAVSQADLQKLGFSSFLSTRIVRYRERGGKFRVKSDLLKIYGVDSTFYNQIKAFIDLPSRREPRQAAKLAERYRYEQRQRNIIEKFDLNTADTTTLSRIRGIGQRLALRIVKYREALGGFVNMDQIKEVYGLDTVVIQRITNSGYLARDILPRQLDINTAGEKDLAAHPYLTGSEARSIVAYRFQHGEFKALDDLRKIQVLKEETLMRIFPYLSIGISSE